MSTAGRPRDRARAVVIGASMGGLCAARVLSDRFDQVTVIDGDRFPADPRSARDHVPQGRHPHLLLVSGARLLERWFPGILAELAAAGAVELDVVADFYWYQGGAPLRRPTTDLVGPAMTRPFLEAMVRRKLEELPAVELRPESRAAGLKIEDGRVTGVLMEDGTSVPATLVIDATGRQARSLPWVTAAGFPAPPVQTVTVDTRYVTRTYRRTHDPERTWQAVAIVDDPATKRMALALPVEEQRWLVVLVGLNGEVPPVDGTERIGWAKALPSPVIADIMASSEPLEEPATYRFPSNQRRRLEKLRRFPLGWALLGDSVCSFDPVYGQGMTSAALQAEALGACLDRSRAVDRRFGRRYFRRVSAVVATPWSIAVGGDFAYPGTTGPKPLGTDVLNRYLDRVTVAGQRDDVVAVRFNEVAAMVRRPESLLTPPFLARVLLQSRRRRTDSPGDPSTRPTRVPTRRRRAL